MTTLVGGKQAELLARHDPRVNSAGLLSNKLTSRQREVLQLIAEGKSAKEIGVALTISAKTAEFHRGAIMDELGLRTSAELSSIRDLNRRYHALTLQDELWGQGIFLVLYDGSDPYCVSRTKSSSARAGLLAD